ncbi:MAG TPA: hypothetical protein VNU94_00895 [Acidobacteriaceae bacterium]|nr:hypothetical protein [Acidobacteriaceae bacterium]
MKRSGAVMLAAAMICSSARAAELSTDAKSAIPQDVQQLIVVDYRAMQNSPTAMQMKERVMPPELKRLESALTQSGLPVNDDTDVLAFAAFRVGGTTDAEGSKHGGGTRLVGIAQGQFQTAKIMASFTKNKTKPVVVRNNNVYPMGSSGLSVVFLNETTMIFGDKDAVAAALDTRDGLTNSFLANSDMMNDMSLVKDSAIWSVLDQDGTQQMMKSVLGEAAQVADFETVRDRLKSSRYTMDFQNGVRFDMNVVTSDSITAATAATLMKAAILLKKTTGTPAEKAALDNTSADSNAGTLIVEFSASDSEFASLMASPLFQSVVK